MPFQPEVQRRTLLPIFTRDERHLDRQRVALPVVRDGVRIVFADATRAQSVFAALRDGEPSVWTHVNDRDRRALDVSVAFVDDAELAVVLSRLVEVLGT